MKTQCPFCCSWPRRTSERRNFCKAGSFWRKSDGRRIPRFRCFDCHRFFSHASRSRCFAQNKRHKNQLIRKLLAGGVSQRETARIAGVNRKTVVRKLLFWEQEGQKVLDRQAQTTQFREVEFDELETFEHTKCKPLSVPLMVEFRSRLVLDFEVARMPANGKLAAISVRKYGPRIDERRVKRHLLFSRIQSAIHPLAVIRSDSNPHYPQDVKKYFPHARHETVKGKRGATTGQGELKKVKWDPIFSLNHTCAMLRANLSRLIRRTWCTTKRPDRLKAHILLYVISHNQRILDRMQHERGPV